MDHDHAPALTFLLFGAPLVVLAIALVDIAASRGSHVARATMLRIETSSVSTQAVALCLLIAGLIHLGLVPGHADERLLAASFVVAGIAFIGVGAAVFTSLPWRTPAAIVLISVLAAYALTRAVGYEAIDALGVAACAVELLALALLWLPARSSRARSRAYASPSR